MADIRLKHYHVRKGRGYWLVTPKMRAHGFENVRCGPDGAQAWAIAQEWEQRWQRARKGQEVSQRKVYPRNSVGYAFERFRHTNEWARKPSRTREDWDRGWQYIEPVFGDLNPSVVSFEMLDGWYSKWCKVKGVGEAGRAMKTWRALYNVMAAMKLCQPKQDPSLAIRKTSVRGRTETWTEGEVVRLVKGAWRAGYRGLACIIAVAWDTSFSPVDVRTLTPAQAMQTAKEWGFLIDRTKSGESAFGTLSVRTQRLVVGYVGSLGVTLLDEAPIFRSRGFAPGPKGGRPRAGVPYTKDALVDDFADLRRLVFGDSEKRRLMDMRRSGAVEANAGGASVEAISAKMGNSIDENKALQRTYMPVNLVAVRAADEHRRKGRKLLGQEHNEFKKLKLGGEKS
ncbi:MAG: hypothetical protein E5Y79_28330 [Mesorhizobium sp.]|uniref:hypothetical protein n=1 Tax=Mesorhizobium sp. TaxID=1871066 RepID=UPI0012083697|nr:hypothetical protein [Mesorhizobium sp.]TIL56716.1 MAG: hypothetical protein E5Y79_28330 [Mesorhizobium sp.]